VGLSEQRRSIHEYPGKEWFWSIILDTTFVKCCRLKLKEGEEKKNEYNGYAEINHANGAVTECCRKVREE